MTEVDEVRQRLELLADEELVSILEDRDEDVWRPEVFDIAASILKERGVKPGKVAESEGELQDEAGIPDLITAAQYINYLDANTDRMALEAAGIKVWLCDEYAPQAEGFHPGVRLQVRTEDFAAAMAVLNSDPVPSSALLPEITEPPCPLCGSREVTESAEIAEVLDHSATSARLSERQMWLYYCASCGHKWSA